MRTAQFHSMSNNVQFVKKVNSIDVIFLFEMAFPDILEVETIAIYQEKNL